MGNKMALSNLKERVLDMPWANQENENTRYKFLLCHAIETVVKDYYNDVMQEISEYYDVRNSVVYIAVGRHLIVVKRDKTILGTVTFVFSVREDGVSDAVVISKEPQMTERDWFEFYEKLVCG